MGEINDTVRAYYEGLKKRESDHIPTICKPGCCEPKVPDYILDILQKMPSGVVRSNRSNYSVIPVALEGCTVVELGCGNGKDVFTVSNLVGETGKVIGIDPSKEAIEAAENYHQVISDKWGYDNITFINGYIEDLDFLADDSVDVVISNYGVSFSPAKEHIFREVWRVLKEGGEMYFSDCYSDRRPPKSVLENPVLAGECLDNAMYIEDFRRLMGEIGWIDLRWITMKEAKIDESFANELDDVKYVTAICRAIKMPTYSEDICEKYGQHTTYKGGVLGMEDAFVLDDCHTYKKDEYRTACGNSGALLQYSRFGKYFNMEGDRETHYGPCSGGLIATHMKENVSCCSDSSSCCETSERENEMSSCCCESDAKEGASSCCGVQTDSEGNCCGTSITNGKEDPNMGHKEVVIVDYLCLDLTVCDRCQGTDGRVAKAVEMVRPIMDMAGYNIVMNKVIIENEALAEKFEFRSSPTVRVNGVDICPTVIENPCSCCESLSDYDVACRQFEFNDRLYEVAPTAFIVKRLLEIVFHNEKDAYPPYEMPENIRGFLQGKAKKDAERVTATAKTPAKPSKPKSSSSC